MRQLIGVRLAHLICIFSIFFVGNASALATLCLPLEEGIDRACNRQLAKDFECSQIGTFAFHEQSCLKDDNNPIIQEIVDASDNSFLSESLLRKYDPVQVARSLIYRLYKKKELPQLKKKDFLSPGYDLYQNTVVQLQFDEKWISSIIQSGFLNTWQVDNKNNKWVAEDHAKRFKVETKLLGISLGKSASTDQQDVVHQIRPKYAYFTFLHPAHPNIPAQYYNLTYGNVFAVLKPELMNRMTFTNCDSFWNQNSHTIKFSKEKPDFSVCSDGGQYAYPEAQIWGPVSLSDVWYFIVDCPRFKHASKEFFKIISSVNPDMAIYSCKQDIPGYGRTNYVPDKLLAGKPIN